MRRKEWELQKGRTRIWENYIIGNSVCVQCDGAMLGSEGNDDIGQVE